MLHKATVHPPSLSTRLRRLAAMLCIAFVSRAASAQQADNVTIEQLQQALAERDAIIVDLLNRVEALEEAEPDSAAENSAPAANGTNGEGRPAATTREAEGVASSRSGDFQIDELTAERALERGLVQEGARLLAPGQIDLTPAFSASRRNGMFPVALMSGEASLVGEVSRTYDVYERRMDLRIGLPWDSQLEIGLPYLTVDQQIETGIDGSVRSVIEQSGSGYGDATIGLSKVLATETASRPNLLGRLTWLTGSGDDRDGPVPLGGGHSGWASRLSAYWRRDPVVFLLSGGYTHYEDDPMLSPGSTLDLSLGLGLAVSPETALVVSLNQALVDEIRRDGVAVPGTDGLTSTLNFAVSMTLGRRLFLHGYTAAGLTDDSPDYGFGVALSSRFDAR